MWLARLTHYLLKHRLLTIAFAFAITFVPVIGILGILIATLITLRKGIVEGAILTVAATLPLVIAFYLTDHHDIASVPLFVWAALGFVVISNILTWVFAVMLRKQASWSVILQVAALIGVLVVSVIHLAYPDVVTWWQEQLTANYNQAQAVTGVLKTQAVATADSQLESINITKNYATGMMMAAILFSAILQLIVARWWEAAVFKPGILRRELHNIRLSQLAGVLFLVSLVLSFYGNPVVLDIMPILYVLFGVAGLSLIHYFFGLITSPTAWFWLSMFYLVLIFGLPISMMFVAMLAWMDIWLDLRKRFKKV